MKRIIALCLFILIGKCSYSQVYVGGNLEADTVKANYFNGHLIGLDSLLGKKADTLQVLLKGNDAPYNPTTEYSPTTRKYVDSVLSVQIRYLTNIDEEYVDWSAALTFYETLTANTVINILNPVEGKEITVAIENPGSYTASFEIPLNYTIIWEGGMVPSLSDSSVSLFKFNRVGSYILGERIGVYSLPYPETPPDTTTPSTGAYQYYVNSSATDIYYVNASKFQVLDGRTLPASSILLGNNTYQFKMSRGETKGMSFLIAWKGQNINDITIEPTAFSGDSGTIAASNFDAYFMPVWWQAEINGDNKDAGGILTQELLVKDPSLIRTDYTTYKNEIKGLQLSSYDGTTGTISYANTNSAFPKYFKIQDSTVLKPFSITNAEQRHKQIWIDISIPENQKPGVYYGAIKVFRDNGYDSIAVIPVKLVVNSFDLAASDFALGCYYGGDFYEAWYNSVIPNDPNSAFDDTYNQLNNWYRFDCKDTAQLRIELQDMFKHGIMYPQSSVSPNSTEHTLLYNIKQSIGMPTDKIFIANSSLQAHANGQKTTAELLTQIGGHRTALLNLGYTEDNIYYYGYDEASSFVQTNLTNIINSVATLRQTYPNAKVFEAASAYGSNVDQMLPWLDKPILFASYNYGAITNAETDTAIARWLRARGELWGYATPQLGRENGEVYRRNYGWLAWKRGFTGMFPWRWTSTQGSMYHDKDGEYRDPAMVYVTYHGVINTIQEKGIRDGYYDMRYITTLQNKIDNLPSGSLKTNAEVWLGDFKTWVGYYNEAVYDEGGDIDGIQMDYLRDTLIGYITYLDNGGQGGGPVNWYDGFSSNKTLTINTSKISGSNTDFPVAFDLSALDDSFWNYVKTDGSDIAVADDENSKLDRQVMGFDKTNKTGVLYFRAPVLSSSHNVFTVFYNKPTANEIDKNTVWRSEYSVVLGFNEETLETFDYTGKHALQFGTNRTTSDKVSGKVGFAADFDNATTDTVSVDYSSDLPLSTGDISISGYVNISSFASGEDFLYYNRLPSNDGFRFLYDNTNSVLKFRIYNGTSPYDAQSSSTTLNNDVWAHVAVVLDRDVNTKFYVNSAATGTSTTLNSLSSEDIQGANSSLGSSRDGGTYRGQLDEIRIYRGVLSSDWILTEYNNLSDQSSFFTVN